MDFKIVEALQLHGNGYIDILHTCTQNSIVEIDCKITNVEITKNVALFGARENTTSKRFVIFTKASNVDGYGRCDYGYDSSSESNTCVTKFSKNKRIVIRKEGTLSSKSFADIMERRSIPKMHTTFDFLTVFDGGFERIHSNDEIWYTSSDGNIVTPYSSQGFNVNIVSNTYEEGKGIIKFDGELTKVAMRGFNAKKTLTSIQLPNSVTMIDSYAFNNCDALASVDIGNSVTVLGEQAFNSCYALTSIKLPNSMLNISTGAFIHCTGLTSIEIPSSITTIGGSAVFYNCNSLTSITCLGTTPPALGITIFDNTNNCPIYVPAESVDSYKAAKNWSTYASRIQSII